MVIACGKGAPNKLKRISVIWFLMQDAIRIQSLGINYTYPEYGTRIEGPCYMHVKWQSQQIGDLEKKNSPSFVSQGFFFATALTATTEYFNNKVLFKAYLCPGTHNVCSHTCWKVVSAYPLSVLHKILRKLRSFPLWLQWSIGQCKWTLSAGNKSFATFDFLKFRFLTMQIR